MATSYSPKIITDGLVLCLDAADKKSYSGSGTTWYDRSSSGNNGTLTNGTSFSSDNGGVLVFDGSNDRVDSFSQDVEPESITIEFWHNWAAVGDNWLLNNQTSSVTNVNHGYQTRIDYPSYNFYARFGVGNTSRTVSHTIVLNEWAHVIATYDPVSEGAKLYWNGQLESTNTGTGAIDYTNVVGLGIGGANDGSRNTAGSLGLVRIYNRALTAAEVLQNYNATKGRFGL
jgi:hypothetical protein